MDKKKQTETVSAVEGQPHYLTFDDALDSVEAFFDDRVKPLGEALEDAMFFVSKRAAKYNGKGRLRVDIEIKPEKGKMLVSSEIDVTVPQRGVLPTAAFVDAEGRLRLDDPDQTRFEFK